MSFDRKAMTDAEFERALLVSAGADAPPHDTSSAWNRFASAAGLAAPVQPAGSEEPRSDVLPDSTGRTAVRGATALKWVLVGAIGGSVVTAVLLRQVRREPRGLTNAFVSRPTASATVGLAVGPPVTERPPTVVATPEPVQPGRRATHAGALRRHARVSAPGDLGKDGGAPVEKASSTLAAEVSRIDAARVALAGGDYDQAVRLVERYQWDFPDGALAPDADVVALEAVAAKHDRAEVARRAALFLARYPGDPHAARVRWLRGH